jgi:hypothetical protein
MELGMTNENKKDNLLYCCLLKIINELTKCLKEIKINLKFKFSKRAVFFNTLLKKKKKKQ